MQDLSVRVGLFLANSAGVSGLKGDISLLSPAGSPRVLDDPVLLVIISSSKDGVVKVGLAVGENTGLVERPVGGINSDRGWLGVDVGDELVASAGSVLSGGLVRSSLDFASLVDSLVWVGSLGSKTLLDDVSEGVDWVSSVASQVSVDDSGTVNQLLFGKVGESFVLKEPVSFNVSGGREGPARSALSLVLDWSDSSLGSPVEGLDVGLGGFFFDIGGLSILGDVSQVLADELFRGDIHEGGFSQDVLGLSSVFLLDVEEVHVVDGQLGVFEFLGGVSLVEGSLPLLEFLDNMSWDSGLLSSEHGGLSWSEGQEGGDEGQSYGGND